MINRDELKGAIKTEYSRLSVSEREQLKIAYLRRKEQYMLWLASRHSSKAHISPQIIFRQEWLPKLRAKGGTLSAIEAELLSKWKSLSAAELEVYTQRCIERNKQIDAENPGDVDAVVCGIPT